VVVGLALAVASGVSVGDDSGVVVLVGVSKVKENPWQVFVKAAPGILCGALGEIDSLRVRYNLPPRNTARNPKAMELIPRTTAFQCFLKLFIYDSLIPS
jgi:hypothetical protein